MRTNTVLQKHDTILRNFSNISQTYESNIKKIQTATKEIFSDQDKQLMMIKNNQEQIVYVDKSHSDAL
jgi:hypothetical protein